MNIDLSGKTAVVTGATGELGRAMVRALAACGADVAIHFLNNKLKADAQAQEVRATGRRAMTVQADVTSAADVAALRDAVVAEFGRADIVVNNAVIQYEWKPVLQQNPADYESQYRSCVLHNVLMAQAFVPAMIERKYGRVISINTECAMQNAPGQSAYVSGKRGMDGVLRVLAREVGEYGITVNQVAPGWMISEKYAGTDQEQQPAYTASVPLRRRGHDRDIANAVCFLASELAAFITGCYLPVCGGNVMPAI